MPRKKISFRYDGYERVTSPNFEQIAELIKRAKGHRSLTEFAELCDMSLPSMSIIVNAKTKSPLSDQLIKSIAENAVPGCGITAELLLEANGMAPKGVSDDVVSYDESQPEPEDQPAKFGMFYEAMTRDVIFASFLSKGYTVTVTPKSPLLDGVFSRLCPDFFAEIKIPGTNGSKKWCFDTMLTNGVVSRKMLFNKFSALIGAAYFMQLREKGIKFSFVIDSAEVLKVIKEQFEDKKISDDISVILIDPINRKIVEEYTLPTTFEESFRINIV